MKSTYGDRDTIGTQYLKAQEDHANDAPIITGDLSTELMKSFVEDLNTCIESRPNGDKPFYITIHEKKDLLMPKAILRRVIPSSKRPYPEDDTVVFYHDPSKGQTLFCWCLPHWAEMDNIIMNENLFEKEYVNDIKAWKRFDLNHFGFTKDDIGNWIIIPDWKDRPLTAEDKKIHFKPILLA